MNYRFNLQPWREIERQQQKRNFIALTGLVFLLAMAFVGANYYIEQDYIQEQQRTKSYLQTQIAQLQSAKKEVEETKLLIDETNKQIEAIEMLQAQRGTALKILDYLANETPASVFVNHLVFNGTRLEIEGVAENDSGVAEFMRVLQSNDLLSVAILRGIQSAKTTNRYEVSPDSEAKSFSVAANLEVFKGEADEVH